MARFFKLPERPRPEIKNNEALFESFPHTTLAMMAAGSGVIAVVTLIMEILTSQAHAMALALPLHFVSLPMGVATMILAGLVARANWRYALPALGLGVIYWSTYVVWLVLFA